MIVEVPGKREAINTSLDEMALLNLRVVLWMKNGSPV